MPSFRHFAVAILLLTSMSIARAQCGDRLVENVRSANDQRLLTTPQLLVVRAGYAYSLALSAGQKGIRGEFTSRGGDQPKRGDELLLINKDGDRKVFPFVEDLTTDSRGGVPIYGNAIQFDFATVEWLSGSDVTTVTLINNTTNRGRRFTIPPSRQAEFRQLVSCFRSEVNPSVVPDVPAVAKAIPSVGRPMAPTVERESGLTAKPGTTTLAQKRQREEETARQEVVDARARLADAKRGLLEQLALEKAKAERAKDRLADEVRASRAAAEAEKTAIAAEVVAARERADMEIGRLATATAERRDRLAAGTAEQVAASAQEVAAARARSAAAVQATERSSAESIAEIRARQAEAAAVERARYAEAQAAYAREVKSAEARSQSKVIEVRQRLEADLAAARRQAILTIDSTAGSIAEVRLAARKEVLAAREKSLRAIAAQEEAAAEAAAQREALTAETRRNHAEALAAAVAAHEAQLGQLAAARVEEHEAFEAERARLERELAAERAAFRDSVEVSRRRSDVEVADARTAAEAEVIASETAAAERIRQIQLEEASAISNAREAAASQRDSIAAAMAAQREMFSRKRQEASDELAVQLKTIESTARASAERATAAHAEREAAISRQRTARRARVAELAAAEAARVERHRLKRVAQLDSLDGILASRRRALDAQLAVPPPEDSVARASRLVTAEAFDLRADALEQARREAAAESVAELTRAEEQRRSREELIARDAAFLDSLHAQTRERRELALAELAELEKRLAADVNEAQTRAIEEQELLLEDLRAIRLEQAEAIAVANEDYARRRSTDRQRHVQQTAAAADAFRRDRAALAAQHQAERRAMLARHEQAVARGKAALDSIGRALAGEIDSARHASDRAIAKFREATAAEAARRQAAMATMEEDRGAFEKMVAEEAAALSSEIDRLSARRNALVEEIAALEARREASVAEETPPDR